MKTFKQIPKNCITTIFHIPITNYQHFAIYFSYLFLKVKSQKLYYII